MDYLTATELAKLWGISSRMVAYYCQNKRIEGAIKKGKTWFIPKTCEKPIDLRYSKKRVNIQGGENKTVEIDKEDLSTIYHTSDVFHDLGLTRETLRYYEKIGLIKPKRRQESQYREFDFYDMSHLMAIDFYKKRGFSSLEIRDLSKTTNTDEYDAMIKNKSINYI